MLERRFGSRRLGWCVQVVWGEQCEPSLHQQMGFKAADLVLVSKQYDNDVNIQSFKQ